MAQSVEERMYFLKEEAYTGSHNFFYNSADFPGIQVLKDNWQVIREEIMGLITGEEEIDVKNLNPPYLSSPDAWKNIYFYNFGWQKHSNCKRFPKTFALLQQVPDLIFAGITVLEPHSRVLPHNGETNTTIRCHLGLQVPASLPVCGVRVGTEEQSWANGQIMMFSDAHYHTTWNESDERRFVLVFDIVRPEYAHDKHSVCANVLGALSLKFFYAKWPKLKNLPYPFISGVHRLFTSFWYVYLPLQQKLGLP